MGISCVLIFVLGFAIAITTVDTASEPICAYKDSQGDTQFLKYLPLLKKGQDYVDFGTDGKCVKRATCSDTLKTEVEDCSKYKVTCANKDRFPGVFPGCCIKC